MMNIKCSKCKAEVYVSIHNYEKHLKNVHDITIKPMNIHEYIKNQKNTFQSSKDGSYKNEEVLKKIKNKLQNETSEILRIAEISKILKIGHELVIDILHNKLNYNKKLQLNSKIEFKYLNLVNEIMRLEPDRLKYQSNETIVFNGLQENRFQIIKQTIQINNVIYNSYFSDNEAIEICKRMSDGIIRKAANSYNQIINVNERKIKILQFHKLAMKALDYYGGYMLTFILNSNILRSSNTKIQVYNGKIKLIEKLEPTFSNIHFNIKDEKYFIRFNRHNEPFFYNYQFTVYNKRNNPIFGINKERELIKNFENRMPYINMFVDLISQISPKIYFGYDNTHCDICGRELTDPISIKYGRGPLCRDNYPCK